MTESERSGWYCPECEKESPHITCDGCKTLICHVCGYPCACGEGDADEELFGERWMAAVESGAAVAAEASVQTYEEWYAEAKAENDSAADWPEVTS